MVDFNDKAKMDLNDERIRVHLGEPGFGTLGGFTSIAFGMFKVTTMFLGSCIGLYILVLALMYIEDSVLKILHHATGDRAKEPPEINDEVGIVAVMMSIAAHLFLTLGGYLESGAVGHRAFWKGIMWSYMVLLGVYAGIIVLTVLSCIGIGFLRRAGLLNAVKKGPKKD